MKRIPPTDAQKADRLAKVLLMLCERPFDYLVADDWDEIRKALTYGGYKLPDADD